MFPVLFSFHSLTIHSYGVFIAIGYLCTIWITSRLAERSGLPAKRFAAVCFYALLAGLVGSRLLFVFTQWSYFSEHPLEIMAIWQGGMVFYGGFVSGFIAALLYFYLVKLPMLPALDILGIVLPIGQAWGRLGCFAAGCCHGSSCDLPWAVRIDSDLVEPLLRNQPIHPVQLYELVLLVFLSLGLYRLWKRGAIAGTITFLYCAGYAALRFVLEFFRGDSIRGYLNDGGLTTSQGIAVGIFLLSLMGFVWLRLRRWRR